MTLQWIIDHYEELPSRKGVDKNRACSVCGWNQSRGIHTGKVNHHRSGIPFHDYVPPNSK